MTNIVSDPALIQQLESAAGGNSGAAQPAQTGAPASPSIVVDPSEIAHLEGGGSPKVPLDAKAGPNGLMWNAQGGYDPNTGELVVGGKPMQDAAPSAALAVGSSFLNGIPIVGPSLEKGVVNADAWVRNKLYGEPQDQTVPAMQGEVANSQGAYPKTTTAAGVGGAAAGLLPLGETALGARALGLEGSLPLKIGQGALGGAAIGGADAAARGNDPAAGAALGLGLGIAAPAAGKAIGTVAKGIFNALPMSAAAPFSGLGQTAQEMLSRAVQGETPQSIAASHGALGPSSFVGDLNNPLAALTKSIADQPDKAAGMVRDAYQARSAADGGRINDAITAALGPQQNLSALVRSETAARSAAADPLYEAWRNTPVPPTDQLRALLPRLNAAGVSNGAATKMAIEGVPGYHQWFKPETQAAAENVTQKGMPEILRMGSGGIQTTPLVGKTLWHETSPENAADIIREDMTNYAPNVRPSNLFVADNPDIALGQGGNGVHIEFNGDLSSGVENKKPGAGDMAGREYRLNANGNNSINRVTVDPGHKLDLGGSFQDRFLSDFDMTKNPDGTTVFTRRAAGHIPQNPGAPGGQLTLDLEASPTAQTYDYMKQALDDKVSGAYKAGENGNARLYQGLKSDLLSAIDNHPDPNVSGVWQAARKAWSGPTAIMTARQEGADALKRSTSPDELIEQIGGYSPPEKQAYIQGLRGNVADIFGATKNGDTLVKNQLLAPNNQAKLQSLIGPDATNSLVTALNQEDALAQSSKRIIGGSPTHQNQQGSVLSGPSAVPGAVANYVSNFALDRPGSWIGMSPGSLINGTEAQALAKARAQISPILTAPNGPNADMAQALLSMAQSRADRGAAGDEAGKLASVLINGAGQEYNRQHVPAMRAYAQALLTHH